MNILGMCGLGEISTFLKKLVNAYEDLILMT